MGLITDILYWISTGLLIPVIVLLIIGFVWSILILGGLYGSHTARRRLHETMQQIFTELESKPAREVDYSSIERFHPALSGAIARIAKLDWNPVHADKVLVDFEMAGDKGLGPSKILMRLGPTLGLMGTLIPMGPALVGLASGDIVSMAANMQVAFATTVVGVFGGGVGFLTLLIKKRWFVQDVNSLQYIIELAQDETS
ncbi:MAG: MotA/TolQ/ExbB proton channel family protein [Planctomycetota bacterium]